PSVCTSCAAWALSVQNSLPTLPYFSAFKLTAPPNVTTHNEGCSVCGSAGSGVLVSRRALRRAARDAGGERRGWQYLGSAGGRLQQLDELQTPGGHLPCLPGAARSRCP
ncbi:hypothetical protein GBAR_LOCUS14495, partial [Geodia barretti]